MYIKNYHKLNDLLRIIGIMFVYIDRYLYLTKGNRFDSKIDRYVKVGHCGHMNMTAVYPGSFDPITNGHIDIIQRGLGIFGHIIVAVLENPKKKPLFTTKERIDMIKSNFNNEKRVEVKAFKGLLVEFARDNLAKIVMRGLRAISDFEYEFQMALMNKKLDSEIETFFMVPSLNYSFLSSRLVKEVCMLGGCLDGLIPKEIENKLKEKFEKNSKITII